MRLQTKLLTGPNERDYVLIIASGVLDIGGLKQILTKVAAVAMRHIDCRVLIDLIETHCELDVVEIYRLFQKPAAELWTKECKTALVSSASDADYDLLSLASAFLVRHGLRFAAFRDAKAAVDWLGRET